MKTSRVVLILPFDYYDILSEEEHRNTLQTGLEEAASKKVFNYGIVYKLVS